MSRIITTKDIRVDLDSIEIEATRHEEVLDILYDAFYGLMWAQDELWEVESEEHQFLSDCLDNVNEPVTETEARRFILTGLIQYETKWIYDLIDRENHNRQNVYDAICLARTRGVSVEEILRVAHECEIRIPWQWL